MRLFIGIWLAGLFHVSCGAFAADVAPNQKFVGLLRDGNRVFDADVRTWDGENSKPTLGGKPVFDAGNPIKWIINRTLPLSGRPPAFVEFSSGDRLPGRVVSFVSTNVSSLIRQPAHLIVEPLEALDQPGQQRPFVVRVETSMLRRVVWKRRTNDRYQPRTAFLLDGRALQFRSVRWSDRKVTLLVEDGIREVAFDQIAEIHLAKTDPWEAYFNQLAVLTPDCSARLVQFETSDGLKVTTSLDRLLPTTSGDKNKSQNWYPIVQPAWSLDPIWVRFAKVRVCRFFMPDRVPLSMIAPSTTRQESIFGSSWRWQVDRTTQKKSLKSAEFEFGWGFGVHARTELHFPLPKMAKAFRTRVGLDQTAGTGGCARGIVLLASKPAAPIFQTNILIGSKVVADSGEKPISVSPASGETLILVADPVLKDRPRGADPFDIRDAVNWFDPELVLDLAQLKTEVASRAFVKIAALAGWKLDGDSSQVAIVSRWDRLNSNDPRFRQLTRPVSAFWSMSREFSIDSRAKWLAISVSRPNIGTTPSTLHVSFNHRAAAEFEVPPRSSRAHPNSILVPIEDYRGKKVQVQIAHIPLGDQSWIDVRGVAVVKYRPGLLRIFEDEAKFAQQLRDGDQSAELESEDKHSGKSSLKIESPQRANPRLLRATICEQPDLDEYRFIQFAWKKSSGREIGLELARDGRFEITEEKQQVAPLTPAQVVALRRRGGNAFDRRGEKRAYRYDAGTPSENDKLSVHLSKKLPNKWQLLTRDLYGDFGDFRLTGFNFVNSDGEAALFDHIYLARAQSDFQYVAEFLPKEIPPEADPNVLRRAIQPQDYGEVLASVAPGFATRSSGSDGILLLKEHRGRKNVVRTHPVAKGKPCILRTVLLVPKRKPTRLLATVSYQDKGDWQLVVNANGEKLQDSLISEKTTKEGWADLKIDLSKFAGKRVLVEVHNYPNDWKAASAYWSKLAIVTDK